MRSWPAPHVPVLPGTGPRPRVHDTATGALVDPTAGGTATLYVCGITPYDATHLGHAATYVAFDLLGRAWRDAGLAVRYVQNVTDVDDPLLERAQRDGVEWTELAEQEIALFREDMTTLGVLPPDVYLGVTEVVDPVAAAIRSLVERGAAYEVDGDVYFSVGSDPHFGTVSSYDAETMLALSAERGGDPDRPGKKHPVDPLLWRAERPGEPAWDSPLGRGRPGWHIECTAIALEHLGETVDVQGGGSDLVFPHHEMGASHASVLTGQWPFARAYVHAGMVGYDGAKMSKSKGNLVFVSRLRADGVDPMSVRLALLGHHYRSDWEWTAADLSAAEARRVRWCDALSRNSGPSADATIAAVRAALAEDLDAPRALAAVDGWVEEQERDGGPEAGSPGVVSRAVDALLGVRL